ncbi:MAG: hypothetical protein BWY83_00318 [bacterium ADurb.Bin478]|nr:MAG: hypothetical protein BWY83_00318 [bacterium ADurb.Bin478]
MKPCQPTAPACLQRPSLYRPRSVARTRILRSVILLLCALVSPLAAEECAFRLIVTANQARVDGDFFVDLQMRTAEASPSPRRLHSLTLDVHHAGALAAYSDTCAVNWALGPGYEASVSKLAGYYRVLVTANGVSGSDAAWSATGDWQRLVTLRWKIAAVSGSYEVAMLVDTDAAAYFIDAPPSDPAEWSTTPKAPADLKLAAKLFLQGPYSAAGDTMSTALCTSDFIPKISPYAEDRRTLDTVPAAVTDWLLLQLRSSATGAVVASRSVLLRKDGRVVGDDAITEEVVIPSLEGEKEYYVVARHRNHLGVMSAHSLALNANTAAEHDFTSGADQYYGGNGKQLEAGCYGLYCGDANGNSWVNATDYSFVFEYIGFNGYSGSDVNLNGWVNATDYNYIYGNIGVNSNSPK